MKYQVFKRLGEWSPVFEKEFKSLDDARMFRNLCQKTEDESGSSARWEYYVAEVIE